MKKVTSLVVLLVLISTSVFAIPATTEVTPVQKAESDLFSTVQATELTGQEMEAVEGEGLLGGFIGGLVGGAVGYLFFGIPGIIKGATIGASLGYYSEISSDSVTIGGKISF